jgi:metal-responsive CopG/Arc/MetJ family transcriptional regulator
LTPSKLARHVIHATPEWLAALDRLVAGVEMTGRSALIEDAVASYARERHLEMPPRCKPPGWNQHRKPEDTP